MSNNAPLVTIDPSGEVPVWLERRFKKQGYKAWRSLFVTAMHWRTVMDNWYYERGPTPFTFTGIRDPRNADIAANPGFVKLLNCWLAKTVGGATVPTGRWRVDPASIQWQYTYDPHDAAGGAAAYDSSTHFLGSYTARLKMLTAAPAPGRLCDIDVEVYNLSGWTSATRVPGRFRGIFGASLFTNHPRGGARYWPSTGGNYEQYYKFTVTGVPCCPTCVLP